MSLPIMTNEQDVEAVANYLKTKALGATLAEARAVLDARLLDGRKLNAYKVWGFITLESEKIKLTPRGRDYTRANSEQKEVIFRTIIHEQKAYNLAIEQMFYKKFEEIAASDVAANWHEHIREEIGSDNECSDPKKLDTKSV